MLTSCRYRRSFGVSFPVHILSITIVPPVLLSCLVLCLFVLMKSIINPLGLIHLNLLVGRYRFKGNRVYFSRRFLIPMKLVWSWLLPENVDHMIDAHVYFLRNFR